MKQITTQVVKVNGIFDVYADKNTVRVQNYSNLATEMGRNWDEMSKRSRSNFRKKHSFRIKAVSTQLEVFEITAIIPNIFCEYQLKEATINHLIHPNTGTLFLKCKNGITGYSTGNFRVKKLR